MGKRFINHYFALEYETEILNENECKITMVSRPYDSVMYFKFAHNGNTDEVNHLVTALHLYNSILDKKS